MLSLVNIEKFMINSRLLIIFICIFFPLWEVLQSQMNFYLHIPIFVIGIIKYTILLMLITILSIELMYKQVLIVKNYALLVGIYTIYIFLHILGDTNPMLIFDGLRYEFIYPFIVTLILMNKNSSLPNLNLLINIIIIQGVILVTLALFELNNQSILEIVYRRPLEDIAHIHWFSINRLISFAINPINLGALTVIFMICLYYKLLEIRNIFMTIIFVIFLILSFIVISGTLSRTSLLTYSLIIFLMFHFYVKNPLYKTLLYISLFLITSIVIIYLNNNYDLSLYIKRFGNLFSSNEYTENARVLHWLHAFSLMNYLDMIWGFGIGKSTPSAELGSLYGGVMIENSFISNFIEFGLIGFWIYVIVYIRYLYLIKILNRYNKNLSIFLFLFFITFILFSLGNDFNRNLPFNIYFWFFYAYLEKEVSLYRSKNAIFINNSNIR